MLFKTTQLQSNKSIVSWTSASCQKNRICHISHYGSTLNLMKMTDKVQSTTIRTDMANSIFPTIHYLSTYKCWCYWCSISNVFNMCNTAWKWNLYWVTNSYYFSSPILSNWSIYTFGVWNITLGYMQMLLYIGILDFTSWGVAEVWRKTEINEILLRTQISLLIKNLHQCHYICKWL